MQPQNHTAIPYVGQSLWKMSLRVLCGGLRCLWMALGATVVQTSEANRGSEGSFFNARTELGMWVRMGPRPPNPLMLR